MMDGLASIIIIMCLGIMCSEADEETRLAGYLAYYASIMFGIISYL